MDITNGQIFLYEMLGTATLILLGCGVVANVALKGTKGNGGGFLLVNFGWGLAVFAGVYVAFKTGAHLNPAVSLAMLLKGTSHGGIDGGQFVTYVAGQFVGAFVGAVLCWVAYKDHFDAEEDAATKLGVFSTGPAMRNYGMNVVTEAIATFMLVFWILVSGGQPSGLGPLAVALVVVGIGASLGGPTGYAINPARDLGPRIAHFLLPIKGKGDSDWGYSWVPVVGPLIGAVLAWGLWKMTGVQDLLDKVTSG